MSIDLSLFKQNISTTLGLTPKNIVKLVEDTRPNAKSGVTAKYQVGIKFNNKKEFDRVQKKIMNIVKNTRCQKKSKNILECSVPAKSEWYEFGQRSGNNGVFYPEKFDKSGFYNINHAVAERLLLSPSVFRKSMLFNMINQLGTMKGGRCCKCFGGRGRWGTSCYDNPEKVKDCRYDACLTIDRNIHDIHINGNINIQNLPARKCISTLHKGSYTTLFNTYDKIYNGPPSKKYAIKYSEPCIEIYKNNPKETPENELLTELYIPID